MNTTEISKEGLAILTPIINLMINTQTSLNLNKTKFYIALFKDKMSYNSYSAIERKRSGSALTSTICKICEALSIELVLQADSESAIPEYLVHQFNDIADLDNTYSSYVIKNLSQQFDFLFKNSRIPLSNICKEIGMSPSNIHGKKLHNFRLNNMAYISNCYKVKFVIRYKYNHVKIEENNKPIAIKAGTDLNDLPVSGEYKVDSDKLESNTPKKYFIIPNTDILLPEIQYKDNCIMAKDISSFNSKIIKIDGKFHLVIELN